MPYLVAGQTFITLIFGCWQAECLQGDLLCPLNQLCFHPKPLAVSALAILSLSCSQRVRLIRKTQWQQHDNTRVVLHLQDSKKASSLGWGSNVKPVTADVTSDAQ